MFICPLCNGLINYEVYCSNCGSKMEIQNRREDYDDSYSPYLSYNLTDLNDGDPPEICSHRAICKKCNNEEIIRIRNIEN